MLLAKILKKRYLTGSERGIFIIAQSVGSSISKTETPVKCPTAALINFLRKQITKQKTVYQRQVCDHH